MNRLVAFIKYWATGWVGTDEWPEYSRLDRWVGLK